LVEELDWRDPAAVLPRLPLSPGLVFLDSAMTHPHLGRWSYLAAEPLGHFTVQDGQARWNGTLLTGRPLEELRRLLGRLATAPILKAPPFTVGATGTFSYEAGRLFERLPPPRLSRHPCPDIELWFHDAAMVFDHNERRAFLISSEQPGTPTPERTRRRERIERLREWLADTAEPAARPPVLIPRQAWRSNMQPQAFRNAVARVRDYVAAGDIFQANIAHRLSAEMPEAYDPVGVYLQLRAANPAPFSAFLAGDGRIVASTSPELFLRLRDRRVETRPIKGTRRRSGDPDEDGALARELLASDKDRAENVMIVDLLRNDLSRVALPGTVRVPALCELESYAAVHHLVSVVTAELQPGKDALDLLAASFPGGSITGAPKIRAMEIIHELEPDRRGVYCGSVLHFGLDGSLHSNIAIRTLVCEGDLASFHVGGGITLLSDPEEEYQETLAKAERLFQAFDPGPAAPRTL
jgi:para-aminobenzoate synthetase component 1